ncbi:DNA polymerase III subunit alpha [Trueperella pyogenes]|uniref:DNA polymerase III subunit alpha n=1 Tax=Trueperella pyogenes TaxID=1661 RepID=UPI000F851E89|nr:DNA polymerase III subunit alpha [Trueperella pyogenes]AZR03275.1 DNA polymerase III subunit alpha [Trueperella pyogenes]WHU59248.1 DNA polymerase III subunit alpha [Trueperella pyogenes]
MAKNFAHLHVHTDYSLLDGAAKINQLVNEVVALGQPAVAITDHGNLHGAYELYKAANKVGIKPIIGLEAYMTPGTSRHDKTRVLWGTEAQRQDDVSARGTYTHMTLLAETNEGMHNLFRMQSLASIEGTVGKYARIDRELLEKYHHGLIGTAGCPSGEIQTRLRLGQYDEALKAAGEFQDIFGKENFYFEVMDHGLEIERRVKDELLTIARTIGAPLLATNDSHYVTQEQATVQDAMLALNSGSTLMDPDRFRFEGTGYYIRSTQDMWNTFGHLEGACENTLEIVERCNVRFETTSDGINYMPKFPVPSGENEKSWFVREVNAGLHRRYGDVIPDDVRERADYEMDVILQMDFPGYFLVVSDYIRWARRHGIRVGPGRGSGAGSMVAYALEITQLDPIKHDLLFERFLNPERISMPDLDIDFDDSRRDEVIEYVEEKYGKDKVSQVVTFGTIKAKQSLKDASRVLGYPYEMGDRLTKAMPPSVMGNDIPVNELFNSSHPRYAEAGEIRELIQNDPDCKKVYDLACGLEGMTRQTGMHACAVIMSSKPLTDVIPVMMRQQDGAILTQFEYPECEELGLIKMDFLGLSNLTVIEAALANIRVNGKEAPDIDQIPLDDPKTYELLARGDTLGIFQLDGAGMRTLLKQMKMDTFADISAVSALYRPGPMGANSHTNYALRKNGLQEKTPIHPELEEDLEEILGATHGLIVFQEQVMRIAQKLAGFTLGQADILRKAMGKKKADVLQQQFASFSQGMLNNGYSQESIDTLWNILLPFSSYAFNKSHSEAYALVSYQTAYLKAHFPAEFMAALLTSKMSDKTKVATYLAECRRMKINVLVPDVNSSLADYTAVGDEIRVGLRAVRNVGTNVVDGIIKAREEKGQFSSFQDFLDKIPLSACNKRSIDCLIKAGGFDSLGECRRALVGIAEEAIDSVTPVKRNEAAGQFDLFGDLGSDTGGGFDVVVPDIPEWDKRDKLNYEREMLGLYVSDHPLSGMENFLNRAADINIVDLLEDGSVRDGQVVTIAGIISSIQTKITKKSGKAWAIATIEDRTGPIDVNFFPNTYQQVSSMLIPDSVVIVEATVRVEDEGPVKLFAKSMTLPPVGEIEIDYPIKLLVDERVCNDQNLNRLAEILQRYPGQSPVRLHVKCAAKDATVVVELANEYWVAPEPSLYTDLKVLLGRDCVL